MELGCVFACRIARICSSRTAVLVKRRWKATGIRTRVNIVEVDRPKIRAAPRPCQVSS